MDNGQQTTECEDNSKILSSRIRDCENPVNFLSFALCPVCLLQCSGWVHCVVCIVHFNAVGAFWVSARGRGDHCLGRFVLPPSFKPGQLASLTNAKVAFVYLCISYFSLLPVPQSLHGSQQKNKVMPFQIFAATKNPVIIISINRWPADPELFWHIILWSSVSSSYHCVLTKHRVRGITSAGDQW